jgi:hypothetical protein
MECEDRRKPSTFRDEAQIRNITDMMSPGIKPPAITWAICAAKFLPKTLDGPIIPPSMTEPTMGTASHPYHLIVWLFRSQR